MLGNKCAGRHNLKMVYFKETTASGFFDMVITMGVLLQRFVYCSKAAPNSPVAMVGRGRPQLFLKVPWVDIQRRGSILAWIVILSVCYKKTVQIRDKFFLYMDPESIINQH